MNNIREVNGYRSKSTGLYHITKFMKAYVGITAFFIISMVTVIVFNTDPAASVTHDAVMYGILAAADPLDTNELQAKLKIMNKDLSGMVAEKKKEDKLLRDYEKTRAVYLEKTISRGAAGRGYLSFSLNEPSGLTADIINKVLAGTPLDGLGDAYIKAEKETGVSALFLLGISVHESSWGNSGFAKERNNIFGYKAYSSDPDKTEWFSSKEECILVVAKCLGENYLTYDGKYYNGNTLKSVNKRYASDESWYLKVNNAMEDIAVKVQAQEGIAATRR